MLGFILPRMGKVQHNWNILNHKETISRLAWPTPSPGQASLCQLSLKFWSTEGIRQRGYGGTKPLARVLSMVRIWFFHEICSCPSPAMSPRPRTRKFSEIGGCPQKKWLYKITILAVTRKNPVSAKGVSNITIKLTMRENPCWTMARVEWSSKRLATRMEFWGV